MKKCPYCAEEIQDEAKICKHCGKDIAEAEKPFYNKNIGLPFLGFIFVIAGFFFWPLWILAVLIFILSEMKKN